MHVLEKVPNGSRHPGVRRRLCALAAWCLVAGMIPQAQTQTPTPAPATPKPPEEKPPVLALKGVSSQAIYDEITRRAQGMMKSLPERVGPLTLPTAGVYTESGPGRSPATYYEKYEVAGEARIASVYEDAIDFKTAKAPDQKLAQIRDADLTGVLVARTASKEKALYGMDERMDFYEVVQKHQQLIGEGAVDPPHPKWEEACQAVGMLVLRTKLTKTASGDFVVDSNTYGPINGLCEDPKKERFWHQPAARALGTGFLIGDNLVCTASHVVKDWMPVEEVRMIFDYELDTSQVPAVVKVKKENVLEFKKVRARSLPLAPKEEGEDWAVLELQKTTTRKPLKLGAGKPKLNTAVYAIGHPGGLPLKVAPGGLVREEINPKKCFIASVDATQGNSGSPVFNFDTHLVEGILVRGNDDFVALVPNGHCQVAVLIDDNYSGEGICSISVIKLNP